MSLTLEERKKRLAEEQAAYDEEMQMRAELESRVQKLRQSRADLYAEQVTAPHGTRSCGGGVFASLARKPVDTCLSTTPARP